MAELPSDERKRAVARKVIELTLDEVDRPHDAVRDMIGGATDGMLAELIVGAALELQGRLSEATKEPATPTDPGLAKAARLPAVWPWLEVNAPLSDLSDFAQYAEGRADMTMREWAIEGILHWGTVTDTVIVTTRPDQARHLYPFLMRHKPRGLSIIGGLKTYSLPGTKPGDRRPYDFANADEWRLLFQAGEYVRAITGRKELVLENETTLAEYTAGHAAIDPQRVSDTLALLSGIAGLTMWNLPAILGNSEDFPARELETTALVWAIANGLPDSVFLSRDPAWYGWRDVATSRQHHETLIAMVGRDRVHDRLLVTPDGLMHYDNRAPRRCYTPAEAVTEVRRVRGRVVNLYTGWKYWVAVAREFAAETARR